MGQPPAGTTQTVVFPILVEVLGSRGEGKWEWWALTGEGKSGGKDRNVSETKKWDNQDHLTTLQRGNSTLSLQCGFNT